MRIQKWSFGVLAVQLALLMVGCGDGGSIFVPGGQPQNVGRSAVIAMINRHNATRDDFGFPPLQEDSRLLEIATDQAFYMADQLELTHVGPGGDHVDDRADSVNYDWRDIAENIASASSGSNAYSLWVNSNEHLNNILANEFEEIGVGGFETDSGQEYWCVVFGREF